MGDSASGQRLDVFGDDILGDQLPIPFELQCRFIKRYLMQQEETVFPLCRVYFDPDIDNGDPAKDERYYWLDKPQLNARGTEFVRDEHGLVTTREFGWDAVGNLHNQLDDAIRQVAMETALGKELREGRKSGDASIVRNLNSCAVEDLASALRNEYNMLDASPDNLRQALRDALGVFYARMHALHPEHAEIEERTHLFPVREEVRERFDARADACQARVQARKIERGEPVGDATARLAEKSAARDGERGVS